MKKIKTYKNFLTEELEINNKFIYEYDKIIVDINSYGDLMNIVDYLERLLNIEIRNILDSDYYNNDKKYLAIISVKIIHHIIKHDLKTIYFSDILLLYSNTTYDELNNMIDFIEKVVDDNYFNKKHVLNISNLNNIKHLLTSGELTSFKEIYLNNKQKSYEGLKTSYIYPYQNIIIIIESAEDVIKIVEHIEKEFNIIINDVKLYLDNCVNGFGAMVLHTNFLYSILYNTITNNYDAHDAFFILRHHNEDIVSYLEMRVSSIYFNRRHVLDLKNINCIKNLILRGEKTTYKSLYVNKNKNIYESLIINRETYEYPFKKIMIMCESLNEYIESVKFIENILNIDIEDYTNQYIDKGIISLSVSKCYDIIDINNEISEISSWDLFDYFKKRSIDNTNDEFLNYINRQTSELFFNMEDVIRNTSELYKIKKLLINGGVDTFKNIYLKNSEKSYESLLNKLEGPKLEDIEFELRNKFNSGSIDITKYYNKAKEYGVKGPTEDEMMEHYKNLLLKHRISFSQFYHEILRFKSFNITFDEIKKIYNNGIIGLKDFITLSVRFNFIDECKDYIDDKMEILIEEIVDGGLYFDIDRIKRQLNLSNRYILDKTKNMTPNQKMIISAQLFLITELRKAIEEGADITYRSYCVVELLRFNSEYNKKAKPLLNYILSILNYPEDYNKYVENYFSECVIKNVKIDNKIYSGLVKDDEVRLITNRTTDKCYITINNRLYITLGKIYEKTSDLKNISMNNLFKTNLTDRLEIYQDDNITITLHEFNNNNIEIL